MSETAQTGYRVLARKYRPSTFETLIGQDAMVRTLANAISSGRLAHAFLLTGVRGVGKTSTARLIAKALNCIGPDGTGGPTITPCGVCEPCQAIGESRHIDVIEMDAASRTGVDDVREIIDAVRYAAVSARFKIYIIDEVHMLSKQAFNALLKTLEEPPPHVKFIFATTEIRKVPVTVLSRCQRFDLKRIPVQTLSDHFQHILEAEKATAEPEALALIARAAEGSVRDGLSILDQALAHGDGAITASAVRDMIGLADRALIIDLLGYILSGEPQPALENLRRQYDSGADPATILQDLLELIHALTRLKLSPESPSETLAHSERIRAIQWTEQLGFSALHQLWQLSLKGLNEVQTAPSPIQAAEMAILRLIHAAGMPDPMDLLRRLEGQDISTKPVSTESAPSPSASPSAELLTHPAVRQQSPALLVAPPADFESLVRLLEANKEGILGKALRDDTQLIRYTPGHVDLKVSDRAPRDLASRLMQCLEKLTGQRWLVSLSQDVATTALTLKQQEEARALQVRQEVLADPLVQAALAVFPEAELVNIQEQTLEAEAPLSEIRSAQA